MLLLMDISIVIPNYNGKDLLEKNLPQVIKTAGETQIVVVDDASTDPSAKFIKKNFPNITLIEKVTNSGFATSVNLGVKAATGDVIFLLNTDAVPDPNCIKQVLTHFREAEVFAVGCLDKSIEQKKVVERGRGVGKIDRGFLIHGRGDTDKTNTLWASGGSSAYRKSLWEKLGGMDELYNPFYWEDIDLSYRALKSGYKIVFDRKAVVEHKHEEGSINKHYKPQEIKQLAYRNQFIFVWKNISSKAYLIQHFFWLPYHLVKTLTRGDMAFTFGFLLALVQWKKIMKQSQQVLKTFIKTDEVVLAPFSHE